MDGRSGEREPFWQRRRECSKVAWSMGEERGGRGMQMKLESDREGPDLAGQDRRKDWTHEQWEGARKDCMDGGHRIRFL